MNEERLPGQVSATGPDGFERGLMLLRGGRYFAAHEAFEEAWRAAPPSERDFYQGLVHVAVAWYQAERANRVGCARQLEKATRRLGPFEAGRRGLDVAGLLAQVERATAVWAAGSPELPALHIPPLVTRQ